MGKDTEFAFGFNVPGDVPSYACPGNVLCTVCGKRHGYCDELTEKLNQQKGDGNPMLPKPKTSGKKGDGKFPARFKPATIKKATKVRIEGVRPFPPAFAVYGKGIFVLLKVGSKLQEWPVRFENQSGNATKAFQGLYETLGNNEKKWAGKTVTLKPQRVKGLSPFVEVSK